jgi:Do/DeqQ family serine protease
MRLDTPNQNNSSDRIYSQVKPQNKQASSLQKTATYLLLPLFGGAIALTGNYLLEKNNLLPNNNTQTPVTIQTQAPQTTARTADTVNINPNNFVIDVVKKEGAAVVRIDSSRTVTSTNTNYLNDPFFQEFFGSQFSRTPEKRVQQGMGSGFITSSDGQILTNAHVVDGADKVTVTLKDGRILEGKVLGTDSVTDVAVVKIDAKDLPTVKLGDSNKVQTGEWAIAIGNPLGLDNSVTTGIISATARNSSQIGISDKRVDFIQTDAAINPGNSGGPLLNAKGEVIGINTAIIQNAQGLGFAIPIDKALDISQQIIANGKAEHPFLGIQMASLTDELKQRIQENSNWNITTDKGVLIVKVVRNTPAAKAGLKPGDVIRSFNGEAVEKSERIQQLVENTKVGDSISLDIIREGKEQKIDVKVGTIPTTSSNSQP